MDSPDSPASMKYCEGVPVVSLPADEWRWMFLVPGIATGLDLAG